MESWYIGDVASVCKRAMIGIHRHTHIHPVTRSLCQLVKWVFVVFSSSRYKSNNKCDQRTIIRTFKLEIRFLVSFSFSVNEPKACRLTTALVAVSCSMFADALAAISSSRRFWFDAFHETKILFVFLLFHPSQPAHIAESHSMFDRLCGKWRDRRKPTKIFLSIKFQEKKNVRVCVTLTMCPRYFHFSSFLRWQMSNCSFSCPCFRLFMEYPCWWSKRISLYDHDLCFTDWMSLSRSVAGPGMCMYEIRFNCTATDDRNSKFTLILRNSPIEALALPTSCFVRACALFYVRVCIELRVRVIRCCFYLLCGWSITIAFIIQMYQIAWNALR